MTLLHLSCTASAGCNAYTYFNWVLLSLCRIHWPRLSSFCYCCWSGWDTQAVWSSHDWLRTRPGCWGCSLPQQGQRHHCHSWVRFSPLKPHKKSVFHHFIQVSMCYCSAEHANYFNLFSSWACFNSLAHSKLPTLQVVSRAARAVHWLWVLVTSFRVAVKDDWQYFEDDLSYHAESGSFFWAAHQPTTMDTVGADCIEKEGCLQNAYLTVTSERPSIKDAKPLIINVVHFAYNQVSLMWMWLVCIPRQSHAFNMKRVL